MAKSYFIILLILFGISYPRVIDSSTYTNYNSPSSLSMFFTSESKLLRLNFLNTDQTKNEIIQIQEADKCISLKLLEEYLVCIRDRNTIHFFSGYSGKTPSLSKIVRIDDFQVSLELGGSLNKLVMLFNREQSKIIIINPQNNFSISGLDLASPI